MQFSRYLGGAIFAVFALTTSALPAWSQASVDESLETAFIYVDTTNGSDTNPGTKSLPLKTIGASVSLAETNNKNSIGSRVIINPGTYRESVTVLPNHISSSLPITFEAAVDGTVFVSGAQQYAGWKTYSGNSQIDTHSWSYAWGLCAPVAGMPTAPDIVLRREMVFVNGTHLNQVLSLNEVVVGTFYVDETHSTIYIWPPAGMNINSADVEVAVLPTLWTVQNQSNIVVRGLTFEYANSCVDSPAVIAQGSDGFSNILFDSDNFMWNNGQGLSLPNPLTYFTVQNSIANHNGETGIQSKESKFGLFSSDVASYNNWRGAQGGFYNWNSSGAHFYAVHDQTIEGLSTYYNQTYGVHFDTDNQNITASSEVSFGNVLASMFVEKSEGPVTFSGSSFCSPTPASYSENVSLKLRNSESVSLTGSTLMDGLDAIWITGHAGGIGVTNWETGQHYNLVTSGLTLMQNTIEAGSAQDVFTDGGLDGSDWTSFKGTLVSDYNTWWNSATTTPWVVPVPKKGTVENFSGWQSTTGQDKHSSWKLPAGQPGSACSVSADASDYWFVMPYNASPLTVTRGSSGTFTATMVPLGWTGNAQLSFDGVQSISGASASWSETTLSPNASATLTLTTKSSTPKGTYPVTMIATSGSLTHTVTVLLTIQ
jgi:hypothetical protein